MPRTFVKISLFIGMLGSIGLMWCVMLPPRGIVFSGAMVMYGFSVHRMDLQRKGR